LRELRRLFVASSLAALGLALSGWWAAFPWQ
jgi:hypothetical protein